jgi:predicted AAA+ superfamily ATPase
MTKKYLPRTLDPFLMNWKAENNRKPLLLRGARQVGKSSLVRSLSTHFDHYIEINFEENRTIHRIFDGDLSPDELCETIAALYNTPVIPGKTLLFLDEIQACLPAISSLRFFYEKMPDLHLVAAGSLLEFALDELPSYGVGRVRSLFVYPFSFDEFLTALGEQGLLSLKRKADAAHPLPAPVHEKLLSLYKKFMILGGMPEAVSKYVQGRDLLEVQSVLDDLLLSVKADFAKYKKRVPVLRIQEVFESVAMQTGGKFVYSKAAPDTRHAQVKEALSLLIMAGLVIPVTHSAANGIPLGAQCDPGKRKMLLYDTGIFQRALGLPLSDLILNDDFESVNKGAIAELSVGLEMLKYSNPLTPADLFYWHKETAGSNAEVDYVIQQLTDIIPVEVKSSRQGSMQSLHVFLKEKKRSRGVRISLENFSCFPGIDVYPLYAVSNLVAS